MSGLCGWLGQDGTTDSARLVERLAGVLPNFGHVEQNTVSGPNFGLALKSHPMTGAFSAEPNVAAAIEGYPRWRDPSLNEIARKDGNARALLLAYKQKGASLFDVLRGSFSFAVLDHGAGKALCAIDRFGIQTLSYAQPSSDLVVFGSTTDAVRAHPKVEATIAIQSIFDYLYFLDRVAAPTTIYREQRKLAPGEYLLLENGHVTVGSYWHMPYRLADHIDKRAAAAELKMRLRDAVQASLAGEDLSQVGAFLSGGLDSSSVVGVAAAMLSDKLRTFTIGFPVEGFDESYYADIASRRYGTRHVEYRVQPQDVLDILLKAVELYDEPFANSSFIPAFHCARIAKEAGVELMLAGDGGDELFAGNKRYADDAIFDYYARLPSCLRHGVLEPLAAHFPRTRNAWLFGKGFRYVQHAKKMVSERMSDNLFQTLALNEVLTLDALLEIDQDAPRRLAQSIYCAPHTASKVQRMMHLDLRVTLADSDLRKVARMCELAGVRVRFPFLDDDLAEFSAQFTETFLMPDGRLRGFYKAAMSDILPDEIVNKKKHGFGLPYVSFMNSYAPLRDLICDSLTNLKQRGYFQPKFLDDLIGRAQDGNLSGHETVAWDLAVLELWLASRKRRAYSSG